MGRILTSSIDHYRTLAEISEKADACEISTFGIYTGITSEGRDVHSYGGKYSNLAHQFLDVLKGFDVKLLIGMPELIYCDKETQQCTHCEEKFIHYLERINHTAKHWPDFDWRIINDMHMKFVGFYKNGKAIGGISGGRNLSDSQWDDVSIVLTKKEVEFFHDHFTKIFNRAATITDDAITKIGNAVIG
jgi:hypothetical protein